MDDQFRDATKKTDDTIYRQSAIETVSEALKGTFVEYQEIAEKMINKIPSAQQDNKLSKIADLVEGTIDHFDLDDAMDLLYQIKEVLKDG